MEKLTLYLNVESSKRQKEMERIREEMERVKT